MQIIMWLIRTPVWNVDSINADIKSGYDTLSYNRVSTDSCAATNAVSRCDLF